MRIFVEPAALAAGSLTIRGDEHHYLSRVRRARPGDTLELVDGAGRRARATISHISDAETTLTASAPEAIVACPPRIRALVPLIKGDRMDACLEKLVEVGVDELIIWPAARSIVRLDAKLEARVAKYQAIAQAAARQSGRADVPAVRYAPNLAAAARSLPDGQRLVLDPTSDAPLSPAAADITLVSGPEGGLAPDELDILLAAAFTPLGLGPRILRAETAPMVAVALIRAATSS